MATRSESDLKHIGTPRHSGRYPWGSGKNPQRSKSFRSYVNELKEQGLSEVEIAKGMGLNTKQLRDKVSMAYAEERAVNVTMATRLLEKGYSETAISQRMGVDTRTVRSWLDKEISDRANISATTALVLKDAVGSTGLIQIGVGVEQHLGISRPKLNTAVAMLQEEGYTVHTIYVEQAGTGKYTAIKVLAPPGTTKADVNKNRYDIKLPIEYYSEDGGRSYNSIEPIQSVSSKRIYVRYKEDGGADKDGMIELRRGVDDISLGGTPYAQVRIGVDDTHFMKGMAIHTNNIPDGYDIVYNVSKSKGEEVFKPLKSDDPDNPIGAALRQKKYTDANGNERLSAINIVGYKEGSGEEGSWNVWSRSISSQVLSKQTPKLAKTQLGLDLAIRKEEYDEIMALTNPAVKKAMLKKFSDECDSAAVHLSAAALPRQNTHVLLSFPSIKEDQVYAPNYDNGERVVLIRHPHGGIFEIPELTVNNSNKEAKAVIGNSRDAIGIHPKTASQLSGADFDGDAVIVIPNKNRNIQIAPQLKALKDFDPRSAYRDLPTGEKPLDARGKGIEMGKISNLITDMTIRGASHDEIARAVKHSMVVIDAEKHKLNYKQSAIDNNIAELKKKYQGSERSGASTIISKASAEKRINERREGRTVVDTATGKKRKIYIDPSTGEKLYEPTGRTYLKRKPIKDPITGKKKYYELDPVTGKKKYYDEEGSILPRKTKTTRMAEEKDAFKLSSGTRMEDIYAEHANNLKGMANKARLDMINTKDRPYNPSARTTYAQEVTALKSALALAYRNKPLERQAQLLTNKIVAAKRRANPDMDPDHLKKAKNQALEEARARYNARKPKIQITDRQWEAIQAGALSPSALEKILENADPTTFVPRAMPKQYKGMSPARTNRAKSLLSLGHTPAEVAEALGVSVTTIHNVING